MAWTESKIIDGQPWYRGRWRTAGKKQQTDWLPSIHQAGWLAELAEKGEIDLTDADRVADLDPSPDPTLAQFTQQWLDRQRANVPDSLNMNTWKSYRGRVTHWTGSPIGRKLIKNLTWADIDSWRQQLDGRASTKNQVIKLLETVYRDAYRRGLVRDLMAITDQRRAKGRVKHGWKLEDWEEDQLLAAAEDDPDMKLMIMLGLDAGLRWGEVAALKVGDVRLSDASPYLMVMETITNVTEVGTVKGTNHRGEDEEPREIPLSPRLIQALKPKLAEARLRGGRQAHLFQAPWGGTVRYATWNRYFTKIKMAAFGHDGVRLKGHDLRRTFASKMEARGLSGSQVQYLLGHQSLSTTQLYLKLGASDRAAMAKAVAA